MPEIALGKSEQLMIETQAQRAKRIKAEQAERDARAANYAQWKAKEDAGKNAGRAPLLPPAARSSIEPVLEKTFDIDESKPISALTVRAIETQINRYLDGAERLLLIIHRTEGWRVAGFDSMAAWAKARINVSKSRAYQLLNYCETAEAIGQNQSTNGGLTVENERQARPMAGLTTPQKRKAWKKAVKAADGAQPTAKQVAAAVETLKPANAHVVATEANLPMHTTEVRGMLTKHPETGNRLCPHCGKEIE